MRRSLLEVFPTTILARSGSQTVIRQSFLIAKRSDIVTSWTDRKVALPHTEFKAALAKDLEYYGFENVDPASISID